MLPSDLRVQHATLDNGLRVVCVEQPLLHGICLSLQLNIGPRFEATHTSGCSHMLEHMLFRGTPSHPNAHAQACAVERLGATLYAATHTAHGHMSVTLPPENFEQGTALFCEIATQPVFSEIDVERGIIREEILEGLDDNERSIDPDGLVRALMYPGHPLGRSITGSLASIELIDEAMLREHHAKFYTGNNSVLCLAGPVEPNRCVDTLAKHLSNMAPGKPPSTSPPPKASGARFEFIENQGSQTDLRLAFRAPGLTDPMEPATDVLARLLDDGMSTRVYAKICDEKGLCYDVSAHYEPFSDDGVLDFAAAVRHDRAELVMNALCDLIVELCERGPTEQELCTCKDRHRWELSALLDRAEGLANYHGFAKLYGISDQLQERQIEIEKITRDQVVEVARGIFRSHQCSAVAVGMLQQVQREQLERLVKMLPMTW
ncbi:MAG: peptidase M16 [Sorangium cellulosum]|nr:MAG: peptidase M16 [Sorangium cellulosum]